MGESMKACKIQKLNGKDTERVLGGCVGKDWNEKYANEYKKFGIKYVRNTLGYDRYYVYGHKVPKKFAHAVVDASFDLEKYSAKNEWLVSEREIMNQLERLKRGLKHGNNLALAKIRGRLRLKFKIRNTMFIIVHIISDQR